MTSGSTSCMFMNSIDNVFLPFIVWLICVMVACIVIGIRLLDGLHVLQPGE